MIKGILFILWALIIPIVLGMKDFVDSSRKKKLVSGDKTYKKPIFDGWNLFPVFCQDVILLFPMYGFMVVLLFVDLGPGIFNLLYILCLAQLAIVDLVRGLKISLSSDGKIRYNSKFFFCVLTFTIFHIISLGGILYVWPVSVLALMFVSVSSSISTWRYIEDLYNGKGKL